MYGWLVAVVGFVTLLGIFGTWRDQRATYGQHHGEYDIARFTALADEYRAGILYLKGA